MKVRSPDGSRRVVSLNATGAGTKSICDALKGNKTLEELDLSGDGWSSNIGGPAGAKHVAELLVTGELTKIDLRNNMLGDDGEAALRKAVEGRSGFELVL